MKICSSNFILPCHHQDGGEKSQGLGTRVFQDKIRQHLLTRQGICWDCVLVKKQSWYKHITNLKTHIAVVLEFKFTDHPNLMQLLWKWWEKTQSLSNLGWYHVTFTGFPGPAPYGPLLPGAPACWTTHDTTVLHDTTREGAMKRSYKKPWSWVWAVSYPYQEWNCVPINGVSWFPQLAVYTTYIPLIYCLLGDYISPTTY